MKSEKKPSRGLVEFNNIGQDGMIGTLKKGNFIQVIGHCSFIQNSKIFKENSKPIGLDLMKLQMYLKMVQSELGLLMKRKLLY